MEQTTQLKKYAVLFVDDEQQATKYYRKGLEKEFPVLTATNVPDALAILERDWASIGAVVSDQRMPGQSGVELLTQVHNRWPAIVRILLTAFSDLDSAVAAVNGGAVYKYLTKPADFALLKQTLVQALDIHRETLTRDALAATLKELEAQRRATEASEAEREQLQQRLLTASREAGRAEVATGILHNIGNVLNSVNVSVAMINKTIQQSKVTNLGKALAMLEEHTADLGTFLTQDERGQRLPGYLGKLSTVLSEEQASIAVELESLARSVEHIRHVVQTQQSYAKQSTVRRLISPSDLMEEALRVNSASFEQAKLTIVREYAEIGEVPLDEHKILQILINLVSNAGKAVLAQASGSGMIRFVIDRFERDGLEHVRYRVIDNGEGIAFENLTSIFKHGFTTRSEGHGFGLHSAANAAREMGGSLAATSAGAGQGATFTLEVPTSSAQSEMSIADVTQKAVA